MAATNKQINLQLLL